jgi:hypothetical protein
MSSGTRDIQEEDTVSAYRVAGNFRFVTNAPKNSSTFGEPEQAVRHCMLCYERLRHDSLERPDTIPTAEGESRMRRML